MAEIVGIVLGGIPLAIWALEKYAEPLEAWHDYRGSIESLHFDLNLQHRQLHVTLSNIGLPDKPSVDELREAFESKYPEISRELMAIIRRMDQTTAGLLRTLDVDINNGKPGAFPQKAQWECRRVKHAFKKKYSKNVINDLRQWNQDLKMALERSSLPSHDDSHVVEDLKRRFNITRSNTIRQCLASFHRALEFGFRCGCSTPHQAAIDLDWASYESDTAKTIKIAVSYEGSSHSQGLGSWRKLGMTSETTTETPETAPDLLTPSRPSIISSPSNSSVRSKFAHFKLSRSFSKTPPPPPIPPIITASSSTSTLVPSSPPPLAPSKPEITSLCAALYTETNPWPLIRFLRDPDDEKPRQYSLHHHPVGSPNIIKAVPLKSLFLPRKQQTRKNAYLSLSSKERFGIAATIAWSVLHLSCSPWLNDHWDRKQMGIFLEKSQNGREMLSRHPCASYVFSPPPICEDETVPDDLGALVPNKTVFALGILLIELCISEPISESGKGGGGLSTDLFEDYKSALSRMDEVYRLAGNSYAYAAERCIKFSFEGRDKLNDFDFETFRGQFYDVVVAPVQATYLAFPDSEYSL